MNLIKRIHQSGMRFFVRQRAKVYKHMLMFKLNKEMTQVGAHTLVELDPEHIADPVYTKEKVDFLVATRHRLFALKVHGELVSYAWVKFSPSYFIKEVKADYDHPFPNPGWIVSCETPEQFRRKGYYVAVLRHLTHMFPTHTFLIYVDAGNKASVAGIKRAGSEFMHSLRHFPVFESRPLINIKRHYQYRMHRRKHRNYRSSIA